MLGAFGSVVNGASFHSVSSRFLNALTVGAETKFTGRAFHKFTTRCVKKCLRTSSLDRPFSWSLAHPTSQVKIRVSMDVYNGKEGRVYFKSFPSLDRNLRQVWIGQS